MADTTELQARLETLERALASGLLTVEYEGRRVTYRDHNQLVAAVACLKRQLGFEKAKTIVFETGKGLS